MKKTTVLDVARRAGVSQGSVSRVLTGKNWVSEEVRGKVEAAVRQLGYVPNAMAQGLKAQRTRTVAAIVSDMSNPLHGEFLSAAEEELRAAGYLMVVANTHSRVEQELALLALFRAGRADGLIVAQADETREETYAALRDSGLPIVFHDRESRWLGGCRARGSPGGRLCGDTAPDRIGAPSYCNPDAGARGPARNASAWKVIGAH